MDNTTKLLLAVGAGVVIYLVVAKKGDPLTERQKDVMRYRSQMWDIGQRMGIEPALIAAIMDQESFGHPDARGLIDEVGLMQIRPGTAAQYCWMQPGKPLTQEQIRQLFTPTTNITCGAKVLKAMLDLFRSIPAAAAAYNAGPGRVSYQPDTGRLNIPNRGYVLSILSLMRRYRPIFFEAYGPVYFSKFPPSLWNVDIEF